MNSDDSPLARWSRRKRAAGRDAPPADAASETAPRQPPEPEAPELSEADYLAAHDLPEPETLKEGDDFAAFLRKGVPHQLRRRALRRLWSTNPVLANLDGLVEYGEDYTNAATVPAVLNTVYTVGKGMVRRASEVADASDTPPAPAEPEPIGTAATGEDGAPPASAEGTEDTARAMEPAPPAADPEVPAPEAPAIMSQVRTAEPVPVRPARPPRRMHFSKGEA